MTLVSSVYSGENVRSSRFDIDARIVGGLHFRDYDEPYRNVANDIKPDCNRGPSAQNAGADYLTWSPRVITWALTLDHKRVAVMYSVAILVTFLSGLLLAMVLRLALASAAGSLITAGAYNRVLTLHGATMVFLVVIPAIPAVFGNFVLPLMLGNKRLAYPWICILSFHLYVLAAIAFLVSVLQDGLDTGWTFAAPYVIQSKAIGVVPVLLGAILLAVSAIMQSINFIATIHKLRPREMNWMRMPVFTWSLYLSSWVQLLTTPILVVVLGMLVVERVSGMGLFGGESGSGGPILYQRFFWFFAAPALLVMILPAIGVVSELISVHSRKPIFGYRAIVGCLVAISILSFSVWGRHWFIGGQSGLANTIFSLLALGLAIPVAIIIFNWLGTMARGAIAWNTPMVYAMMFICFMTIGGMSGLFLSALATDVHLQGTLFESAHLHYIMMGGVLIAFLGALHHWWPKFTGRMYDETFGLFCAFAIFVSFNITFLPQFIMGSRGMPRQYFDYPLEFETLQQISTIGSASLAVALCLIPVYLFFSLQHGNPAPDNPWGGATLEWQTASPPPFYNFEQPPTVGDPYSFAELEYNADIQGFVLGPVEDDVAESSVRDP